MTAPTPIHLCLPDRRESRRHTIGASSRKTFIIIIIMNINVIITIIIIIIIIMLNDLLGRRHTGHHHSYKSTSLFTFIKNRIWKAVFAPTLSGFGCTSGKACIWSNFKEHQWVGEFDGLILQCGSSEKTQPEFVSIVSKTPVRDDRNFAKKQ